MRPIYGDDLLELESRKSFDFFWKEANTDKESPGYGLIRDRAPGRPEVASIAAVGYGLTAIAIGAERGWVSRKRAYERTLGTLNTMLYNVEHVNGFFFHFLDMQTAKRYWRCEASIIDTALALCGALTAGEYFGGEIREKAHAIYDRVDWNWYRNPRTNHYYMGYTPERGFFGAWNMTAEQFMMFFLGFASPTHPVSPDMFYSFERPRASYGGLPPVIHSPGGSLFVYQFSHAWFDLRNKRDREGVDWWRNSVLATLANRQYCSDYSDIYKTYGENSWGLTACDGPRGYSGSYGAPPRKTSNMHDGNDGTVPPCGAAGSMVFTPEESISALEYYYSNFPQLWGEYGFKDAYNLDVDPAWFGKDVIGIDKGISLLMIENYRTGFVWNTFMKNEYAQKGMEMAGIAGMDSIETKEPVQIPV